MYTIQTLNKISPAGTSLFDPAVYTVTDTAQNPDAIMVRSASMHEMEFPISCWQLQEPAPASITFR